MKSKELADRLREVILNGTWVANTNFKDQIEDMDFQSANLSLAGRNSIGLLSQHIHYYIGGVLKAFQTGQLTIRDKYSFDFSPFESQQQWKDFQESFWKDTEALAQIIQAMPDADLGAAFIDPKYGHMQRNIDGLIEHSYYHLGQVALLKKMIAQQNGVE